MSNWASVTLVVVGEVIGEARLWKTEETSGMSSIKEDISGSLVAGKRKEHNLICHMNQ